MARPLDARLLDACVEGCAATHQLLLETVDAISPEAFAEPSRLPGWSRGTLVGHLALNAQSHVELLAAAARGESARQYGGGPEVRAAVIAEASLWEPEKAVKELRKAIYSLEGAWAGSTYDTWQGTGIASSGSVISMHELPFLRWRECVLHLTDLDVGIEYDQWPSHYVRLELDRQKMAWAASHAMGLTQLPQAAMKLDENHRLAWILQRAEVAGLPQGLGL